MISLLINSWKRPDNIYKIIETQKDYDLIREIVLAEASSNFIVIGDKSKLVDKIGQNFPIPLEISPVAWKITKNLIEKISDSCELRMNVAGDAFAITSYGNFVLDCKFQYKTIEALAKILSSIPGVFDHGIFYKIASKALIANNGKITVLN